jgi:hypothetical protein
VAGARGGWCTRTSLRIHGNRSENDWKQQETISFTRPTVCRYFFYLESHSSKTSPSVFRLCRVSETLDKINVSGSDGKSPSTATTVCTLPQCIYIYIYIYIYRAGITGVLGFQ